MAWTVSRWHGKLSDGLESFQVAGKLSMFIQTFQVYENFPGSIAALLPWFFRLWGTCYLIWADHTGSPVYHLCELYPSHWKSFMSLGKCELESGRNGFVIIWTSKRTLFNFLFQVVWMKFPDKSNKPYYCPPLAPFMSFKTPLKTPPKNLMS